MRPRLVPSSSDVPPKAAFDGFPDDLPVRNRRYLEDALANARGQRAEYPLSSN